MSGMIKLSCASGGSGGGSLNKAPTIRNFRIDGQVTKERVVFKYIAEDFEGTILRHFIYISGQRQEITRVVGYEQVNNEFTYSLSQLSVGTEYNIQIEVSDGLDTVRSDTIKVMIEGTANYGVRVMTNNSNPESCCSYINNAVGVTPANKTNLGGWQNKFPFNNIKIVGFKNGAVTKEIMPANKTQYTDGSPVPNDVDVMIQIPKFYWKFENITNGFEVSISSEKLDSGFDCYAHKVGGVEKDNIYVGTYLGYKEGGKLRSKSGVTPSGNMTLTEFRYAAEAVGDGYRLWNWYTLVALQILYLIAYKNLDSQVALGKGNSGSFSSSSIKNTGGTDAKGMVFGSTNGAEQMCLFGIEDLWGNLLQLVDGMYFDSVNILATKDNRTFSDDPSVYESIGAGTKLGYGYIKTVAHTNKAGFFPTSTGGSETTYFPDYGSVGNGYFGASGGYYSDREYAGMFDLYVYFASYSSYSYLGSRLCYLG